MFHECRHIKTNGQRCHGAALRGKPYCYSHMNLRRMNSPKLAENQTFRLPPIEDTASVLLAVGQVINHLKSPYADTKRAGLMLYALQIAAQLTARQENARPEECVRELYDPEGQDLDFSTALDNGIEMLAPDKTICEPPNDCRTCPKQNTCNNYEDPDDEEEYEEEDEYEDEESTPDDDDEEEEEDLESGLIDEDETGDAEFMDAAECPIHSAGMGGKANPLAVLNQPSNDCHSDRP